MYPKQPKRLLPQQGENSESYVEITPFETGRMVARAANLVENAPGELMGTSWRFLLKHPQNCTALWFDMGISHDFAMYPPQIQRVNDHFKPIPSKTSIEQDTISCGLDPSNIKHVIISHAHWDHIHPLPPSFTDANMIVGPGSSSHCTPSYPTDPTSTFDGKIWDPFLRSFSLHELPPVTDTETWLPLGPFPHTYDFFGDGSFYLIDAPGHMTGNLSAIARVKTKIGEHKWVILGGDAAHCNLFTYWPEAPFGNMPVALFPSGCLHECGEEARETIRWIAECKKNEKNNLFVWYGHGEFLEGLWELA